MLISWIEVLIGQEETNIKHEKKSLNMSRRIECSVTISFGMSKLIENIK